MVRKTTILLILSILITGQLFAHSGKPDYHIIIDTDGALDDMRSLSMFLSANDVRTLAITCSQGTLLPDSVYVKVNSLLSTLHHEGIRLGIGDETGQKLPVWSSFAQNISWGNMPDPERSSVKSDANQILTSATKNYPEKVTLIALGSLKTYADWFKTNPESLDRIDRIVWYNDRDIRNGFNYQASPESFDFIKQTGIRLDVIGNSTDNLVVDDTYLDIIRSINSVYAEQIGSVHTQAQIVERIKQKHLQLWDDLVPLYLTAPLLFESETDENISIVGISKGMPEMFVFEAMAKILDSSSETNNRVFNKFPVDTSLYKHEYVDILDATIESFGLTEWKAICMTNEIHGHTGIYSIIGAKMGVRAMEYFNVGVNSIYVTTFAGHKPPLSCFNDGIQISTGATIGQGLITIADSITKIPTAIFETNGQIVKISLKPEISAQMQKQIKYGVQTWGLQDDRYWLYIEELAIRYWNEYNRHEIFDIEVIS